MFRGLIESLLIHGAILFLLLIGGASFGTGSGPKTMSLQMSTFLVEEHDPGDGDAPAAMVEDAPAEPVQEKVEPKKEIKKEEPKPQPKPEPTPEAVPVPVEEPVETSSDTDSTDSSDTETVEAQTPSGSSQEYDGTGADGGSGTGAAMGGGASDGIFSLKDLDLVPKLLNNKKPEYPRYAKENRISGSVKLSFVVDKKGNVTNLEVVEATPPNVFEASAMAAASRWKFSPAKKSGDTVQVRMVIVLRFNLEEY